MKKDRRIVSIVYNLGSIIVTLVELVGCLTRNVYICIWVGFFLAIVLIANIAMKFHGIKSTGEQRARRLKSLDKQYADIKKSLLNKELSDIERDNLLKIEVDILDERTKAEDLYYKNEAAIKQEYNKRLLTCGIALALLLTVSAAPSIYASAKEMVSMIQGTYEDDKDKGEEQVDEISMDTSEKSDEGDIQEEHNEPKDSESIGTIIKGMSFYLDNPTLEWIPTPEMEAAVFYVNVDNPDIQNIVRQHVDNLLNKNLKDTYNNCLSAAEECLAADASDLETDFDGSRKLVRQYAAEDNYLEWREELRHSSDLDDIIEKRLKVWGSQKRNGTMASLLANNYQDYALEYQNQSKSGYTILSYYMETIIWSEEELSYEDTDKEEAFKYLKARYWDIATCQAIPEQYRKNAEAIYLEMGDYQNYMK